MVHWSAEKLLLPLQCAGNDDIITMKAEDAGDTVSFMFESPTQDRIAGGAQPCTLVHDTRGRAHRVAEGGSRAF